MNVYQKSAKLEMVGVMPMLIWHGMTGKAYSRALRGHLIIDHALSKIIVDKLDDDSFIADLEPIYNNILEGKKEIQEMESNNMLHEIRVKIDEMRKSLENESRTSKLWIQYQRIVDIIR